MSPSFQNLRENDIKISFMSPCFQNLREDDIKISFMSPCFEPFHNIEYYIIAVKFTQYMKPEKYLL